MNISPHILEDYERDSMVRMKNLFAHAKVKAQLACFQSSRGRFAATVPTPPRRPPPNLNETYEEGDNGALRFQKSAEKPQPVALLRLDL